jgi:hypothetical protein
VAAAPAPVLATRLALVPAVAAVAAPVEAINRAPDLAIRPVLAPAISPVEVVGTNSRYRGE